MSSSKAFREIPVKWRKMVGDFGSLQVQHGHFRPFTWSYGWGYNGSSVSVKRLWRNKFNEVSAEPVKEKASFRG